MNKEQQDKLWSDLPEEYKSCYSVKYKRAKSLLKDDPNNFAAYEVIRAIVPLFGEHNLDSKPVKKEGWIVIYSCGDPIAGRIIYKTKEEARKNAVGPNNPQIAKIEWE